ncbi:hypothetical protein DFH09DRAFT_224693 [Mycena vulgaris]|nr:hypothetical protein DFH09DRAFT_224693 [Mycena vulgaris]
MQFSLVTLLAVFAAGAVAGPAPFFMRRGCDIGQCVIDIGPAVIGCAAAIAEEGANPFADATCLLSAAKDIKNFPASCTGCPEQLDVTSAIDSATNAVENGISSIGDEIENGISSIGDEIGDLF